MANAPSQRVLRPGVIIADKYRIDKPIARGGFSVIYRGTHTGMERPVALKLLALDDEIKPSWLERFTREAKLASQLTHPNTVTIFDYGQDPRGFLYIVMEWVEGQSLYQHLKQNGALRPRQVAEIAVQILESLDEAHQRRFLHRDLKPSNIMLTNDYEGRDTIKVLDFGIAKNLEESQDGGVLITHQGAFVGTPRYASPEQFDGRELAPSADIYSLGLLMWEALVGDPAVASVSYGECVEKHLGDEPWRLPDAVQCPSGLARILYRALDKDVSQRYSSCRQMRADLRQWLDSSEASEFDQGDFFGSIPAGGMEIGDQSSVEDELFAGIGEDRDPEQAPPLELHGPSSDARSARLPGSPGDAGDDFERELMALAKSSRHSGGGPSREKQPTDGYSGEIRAGDRHAGDRHAGDRRAGDRRAGDGRAGDGRAGDGRAGDGGTPDNSHRDNDRRNITRAISAFAVLLIVLAGLYGLWGAGNEEPASEDEAVSSADEEAPSAESPPESSAAEADDGTPTYSAATILTAVRQSGWRPIGDSDEVDFDDIVQTSERFRKDGKTVTVSVYEAPTHEDAIPYERTAEEPTQAIRFGKTVVQVSPGARGSSTQGVYSLMSTLFELKSIAREQVEDDE